MTRYTFDPSRSTLTMAARSSVHPIEVQSSDLGGDLELELDREGRLVPGAPVAGTLEVPVGALATGNPLYDRELRRRLDPRRYPSIEARLEGVAPDDQPGRYRVRGTVAFRGASHVAEDLMTLQVEEDGSVVVEGAHQFDIRDFGLEPPRIAMLKVYPEVEVQARLVARPAIPDAGQGG
ncbi:YceI family protein [Aciditerrimonas ferrireducens]|jgi:hypothetical protein|uniref:YceI family protein n=1 Tax=Aciditerrimonas ferrireducens TaxID=667306 RepID=A0ABV6C2E1_9ACTN